jgi:hypothetical protein
MKYGALVELAAEQAGCGAPIHRSLVDQRHEANYWPLGMA